MNPSTTQRNKNILEAVLSGKNYEQCALQFALSVSSIFNAVHAMLKLLTEHSDMAVFKSSSYNYVIERKEEIQKALAYPIPLTPITRPAKSWLRTQFGKYYSREAAKIAAEWPTIEKTLSTILQKQDLTSIQNWLVSEGFHPGNAMTAGMLAFTWESLTEALAVLKTEKDNYAFQINSIESKKNKLILHAEIEENGRRVSRQFSLELKFD